MIEKLMLTALKQCQQPMNIKFDKIETGGNTLGVPDTHFYSERYRIFGWMELKHIPTLNTTIIKIPWRPGQLLKGAQYCKAGENVWMCFSVDNVDDFWFIPCDLWRDRYIVEDLYGNNKIIQYHKTLLNEKRLMRILQ